MSEKPTIEQYIENIKDKQFRAYQCGGCGAVVAPPQGSCYSCGASDFKWTEVSGKGTLVSFTVIHIAPDEFQNEAPYIIGLVELDEGTRITARLLGWDPNKPEEIEVGTKLILDYEESDAGRTHLAFKPA